MPGSKKLQICLIIFLVFIEVGRDTLLYYSTVTSFLSPYILYSGLTYIFCRSMVAFLFEFFAFLLHFC